MTAINPVAAFAQPIYTGAAGDVAGVAQTGTAYPLNIDNAIRAGQRIAIAFAPQPSSPQAMTVTLQPGFIWTGSTLTELAAQTTGTITAPVTNPRIDRVVVDAVTGVVSVVTGTPAGSPVAPAVPAGKIPVAQVKLQTTTTSIGTSEIYDERVGSGASGSVLPGYIGGLALSNDGGTPNTVLDIATGAAASSDGLTLMTLASAFTKTTGAWAVGSGNGGLDTGAVANSTWYHVWLIERTDTGVVDVLFSTSATAPTMPTSYTAKRRIGSFKTSGAAAILAYTQLGTGNRRRYLWKATVADVSGSAVSNGGTTTFTLASVPAGIKVDAMINAEAGGVNAAHVGFWSPDGPSPPPQTGTLQVNGKDTQAAMIVSTSTSQTILATADNTGITSTITTLGWYDDI